MRAHELRKLGRSEVMLPLLGFGGAPLGQLFDEVTDADAERTLAAAWEGGVRYFDTSPWYGRGLSEHRLGRYLYRMPREEFLLSTKVGRLFTPPLNRQTFLASDRLWAAGLPFQHHYDYSYEGVMRSYEDSVQRLGMDRIDILIIHDLDIVNLRSETLVAAHLAQLAVGGIRALRELKETGRIGAIGVGVNRVGTIPRFLEVLPDVDFFLVALPYTLVDQPVLDVEFPLCQERGVGIVIGGVFASGILATGAVPGAKYNYGDPTEHQLERVRRIEAVCVRHGVPLATAALQFPLHHPLVASVIPGAVNPGQVRENIEAIRCDIPTELWRDLKEEGLIREDAPTP